MEISSFSIVTETPEELASFFEELFAFRVKGGGDFYSIDAGAISFTIMRGALVPIGEISGLIIQIEVADATAVIDDVASRGARILRAPARTDWGTISAFVGGPGDLVVEIFQTDGHNLVQ